MSAYASGLFDGTTSMITYGDNINPTGTQFVGVGVWVKCASATPTTMQTIVGKVDNSTGQGWFLRVRGDVAGDPWEIGVQTAVGTGCIIRIPRTSDTNWHHVFGFYGGLLGTTLMQAGEDGIIGAKTLVLNNLAGGNIVTNKNLQISGQDGTNNLFDGSLAHACVFFRAAATATTTVRQYQQLMHHSNFTNPGLGDPTLSPALYAPMDTSGNMGRDLLGGLTPTVTGVTYQTSTAPTDVFESASSLTFNGTTSGIGTNSSNGGNLDMAAFTYIFWVYPTSQGEGSAGRLFSKASTSVNGHQLYNSSTNALTLFVDYATNNMLLQSSNNTFTMNAWHKVAVTYSSATATNNHIYIDDVETTYQTTQNGTGAKVTDAGTSEIIGNLLDQSATFAGEIAGRQVYNSALTLAQIKECRLDKPLYMTSLVSWQRFHGWDFADQAGNNNHGSFLNATARPALSHNAYPGL